MKCCFGRTRNDTIASVNNEGNQFKITDSKEWVIEIDDIVA